MATLKIIESIMTKNPCYTQGRKMKVKGLMLHSVGCPQPGAMAFIRNWDSPDFDRACVHGFIDGNTGEVYQTLPWDTRGWHAGGSANDTHIGVEMCEPACIRYTQGATFTCSDTVQARAVAQRTYEAAVLLFAQLCQMYSLDPLADGVIISHAEGYRRGVASNHADPEHLWRQLSMSNTMDGFRQDVKNAMGGAAVMPAPAPAVEPVAVAETENDRAVWDYLYARIGNAYGAAGMMGNLYSESGMKPTNLQNSFEKKLGLDDVSYTAAVDSGIYTNFADDRAGYGLAQWTYPTRKSHLFEFAKSRGASIGDLSMQLDFLWKELTEGYKGVLSVLKSAGSVEEASTAVLTQFERPADQGEAVRKRRAGYGQTYYNRFASAPAQTLYRVRKSWEDKASQLGAFRILENAKKRADKNPGYSVFDESGTMVYHSEAEEFSPFRVRVTIDDLNIRTGPGIDNPQTGLFTGIGTFTILEVRQGAGSRSGWGRLKSGAGWIALDYALRM